MKRDLLLILVILIVILLSGCKSIEYVPLKTTTHDTIKQVRIDKIEHYVKDSVIIETKGDTVYKTSWRTRIKDSISIEHDTIKEFEEVEVPVPVTVEEKYPVKKKVKLLMGGILLGGFLAVLLFLLVKFKIF